MSGRGRSRDLCGSGGGKAFCCFVDISAAPFATSVRSLFCSTGPRPTKAKRMKAAPPISLACLVLGPADFRIHVERISGQNAFRMPKWLKTSHKHDMPRPQLRQRPRLWATFRPPQKPRRPAKNGKAGEREMYIYFLLLTFFLFFFLFFFFWLCLALGCVRIWRFLWKITMFSSHSFAVVRPISPFPHDPTPLTTLSPSCWPGTRPQSDAFTWPQHLPRYICTYITLLCPPFCVLGSWQFRCLTFLRQALETNEMRGRCGGSAKGVGCAASGWCCQGSQGCGWVAANILLLMMPLMSWRNYFYIHIFPFLNTV